MNAKQKIYDFKFSKFFFSILLLLSIALPKASFGAEERTSSSIKLKDASLNDQISVQNPFYGSSASYLTGQDYNGQLKLKLYFDRNYETEPFFFLGSQDFQVVVGYSVNMTLTNTTSVTKTGTMTIKYRVTEGGEIEDRVEIDHSRYDNGGGAIGNYNVDKAVVTITSMDIQDLSGLSILGTFPDNVVLEAELISERFLDISTTAPTSNYAPIDLTNRYIHLRFPFTPGAEYHEIEWLFVSDGSETGDHTSEAIPVDFKDASRIRIRENYYSLPLEFGRGSLIYRYRIVGMDAQGEYTYSAWSYTPTSSTISDINTDQTAAFGTNYFYQYISTSQALNEDLNWEYSSVFAENGLRKDQLRFFDGLGRDKQTVTLLSSDDYAVVMENEYDYAGRPALQMLPTPITSQGLQYYSANTAFSHADYFSDTKLDNVTSGTGETPAALPSGNIANDYYSSANTINSEFRDWIPDAEGYPYTQVQYDNNGTGRVIQQGGLGEAFALKSGKNKTYLYSRPTQSELDRLFGNEVGSAINYSKDYVIDENEQVSVTYKDGSDRVIATALTGATPSNMVSLPRNPETLSSKLFQNKTETETGVIEDFTMVTVPVQGSYFFQQTFGSFTPPTTCNTVYKYPDSPTLDVEISLINVRTGNVEMGVSGSYSPTAMPLVLGNTETLLPGTYILKRTIKANQFTIDINRDLLKINLMSEMGSIDECVTYNLDTDNPCGDPDCITSCEESFTIDINGVTHYLDVDGNVYTTQTTQVTDAINDCKAACNSAENKSNDLDYCEIRYESLIADLSPGGQYFENLGPRLQYANDGSILLNAQGQNDYDSSIDWYDWLETNIGLSAFNTLASTSYADWDEVRSNWQSSWADLIVADHPEYCVYEAYCLCLGSNSIDIGLWDFVNRMNRENTDSYATSDPNYPLFNPLGINTYGSHFDGYLDNSEYMPYGNDRFDSIIFAGQSALDLDGLLCELMLASQGNTYDLDNIGTFIEDKLTNFLTFTPTNSGTPVSHSIWYVLDDPSGIAEDNGGNTSFLPTEVVSFYDQMHGSSAITNPTFDNVGKYEFFRSVYLFYREMALYKLVEENSICSPSTRELDNDDYDGLTAIQNGWKLTFPPNRLFDDFDNLITTAGMQQHIDDNMPRLEENTELQDCICGELSTLFDENNNDWDDVETYLIGTYGVSLTATQLDDLNDDCENSIYTSLNTIFSHPHFEYCTFGEGFDVSNMAPTYNANACGDAYDMAALIQAEADFEQGVNDLLDQMEVEYKQAIANFIRTEDFELTYTIDEYNYTLYYYDQAGNLVKTVPPQGVNPLPATTSGSDPIIDDANDYRTGASGSSYTRPTHDFQTSYHYNTLNQLIEQFTPDGGITQFWYDALGRIVLSQNAQQQIDEHYSYTLYDGLGRIVESGQCDLGSVPTLGDLVTSDFLQNNISSRTQVSHTLYDDAYTAISGNISQEYLQNRVSATMYYSSLSNTISNIQNPAGDPFGYGVPEQAYLYDYDVLGNVKTLYAYSTDLSNAGHTYITMAYDYDLLSGNVKQVSYEPETDNAFYHQYAYDADNRIKYVETSLNGEIWDRDATYYYYPHGPLARVERGERLVQGEDFVYTIQGWLKSVNGSTLGTHDANRSYDAGEDGKDNTLNQYVGRDAFAYSLHYFSGDYTAVNDYHDVLVSNIPSAILHNDLYNGNIAAMSNQMRDNTQSSVDAHLNGYSYDQLNRISSFDTYTHSDLTSNNNASSATAGSYGANYTYDSNGNLETLSRSNQSQTTIDNFTYNYTDNSVDYLRNRLVSVNDASSNSGNDLSAGNHAYTYDAIGNLITDASEGISDIEWNVMNKVTTISKSSGDDIEFSYDALGNRILKSVRTSGDVDKTFYIRDAQGNTMATYSLPSGQSTAQLSEANIFGSSRAGVLNHYASTSTTTTATTYTRKLSNKRYELANHLGNVLSVVSDAPMLESKDEILYEYDFSDGTTTDWSVAGTTLISNVDQKLLVETTTSHGNPILKKTLTAGTYTYSFDLGEYNGSGAHPYPTQVNMMVQDRTSGISILASGVTTGPGVNSITFTVTGSGNRDIWMMSPVPNVQRIEPFHFTLDDVIVTEEDASLYTEADVISYQDYYPFGMTMDGRFATGDDYRYGFNGKEMDNEMSGNGNQYDYGFRIYGPRLGKFLSIDPITSSYPMLTPYQYASNSPIMFIDLDGLEGIFPEQDPTEQGLKVETEVVNEDKINGFNLIKVTVIHKTTVTGEVKIVEALIYQSKNKSKGLSNWNYLSLFTAKHPQIAKDASLIAGTLDPNNGYMGYGSNKSQSEDRKKSVVGIFTLVVSNHLGEKFGDGDNQQFAKTFRHQVYSGLLQDIYGSDMAKKIGDYNEMGNNGLGLFKNPGLFGAGDLMNNSWGRQSMQDFISTNGEINNIDDFTNYLNFSADRLTEYFDVLEGADVNFSSDMEGVKKLYNHFTKLKKANSDAE